MNFKLPKKNLFKAIIIMAILIIGILVEIFGFNFKYFTLSQEEKGIQKINIESIQFNDIEPDGDKLKITGDNPYFQIQGDRNISYLKIKLVSGTSQFILTPIANGKEGKSYGANNSFKDNSYLNVNEKSNNVIFKVTADKDIQYISIDQISIDNSFTFNWIRFMLIISIGLIGAFLVLYNDIAKEKLHVTFIVIALGIGINISIMAPPYRAYDEREHFVKAYQVANLELGLGFHPNVEWIDNMDNFFASNGMSSFDSYKERLDFINRFSSNDYRNVQQYPTTASTYLFTAYVPAAIGIAIGKILSLPFMFTFYLGRIMSLIVFSLIGFYIIKYIKIAKRLVFMVMLLPSVIYTAGSYSADGATLIFSLASLAVFINMLANKEKSIKFKEIGLFTLCVAIMTMSKVSYAPLCLLILAVPNNRFQKKSTALYSKIGVLGITGMFVGGTLLFAISKNLEQWVMPNVSVSGQLKFILSNIFTYIGIVFDSFGSSFFLYMSGALGQLAYSYEFKPIYVICMCITLVVVSIVDNESDVLELRGKEKLIIAVSVIGSWGLVVTALYLTFNPVGSYSIEGVQGRYLLPLLIPALLVFKNNKVRTNFNKKKLNYILSIAFICILLVASIELFQIYNI